jgi:hypothetical protein
MPEVSCQAGGCAHNLGGKICNAEQVEINGYLNMDEQESECATFLPRGFSAALVARENVNYAGLVIQAFARERQANPLIFCNLETCRNNSGGGCEAENISIFGSRALSSRETGCRDYTQ